MVAKTIQFEIDEAEHRRLEALAIARGQSTDDLARELITQQLASRSPEPANPPLVGEARYQKMVELGIIGCVNDPDLPTDLSTNPKHMEGFGE